VKLEVARALLGVAALGVVTSACAPSGPPAPKWTAPHRTAAAAPPPSAAPTSPGAPLAERLEVASAPPADEHVRVEALSIAGFLPAVLVVPPSSLGKRPLLVVTHGAGGRPEAHCDRYRQLTHDEVFVLCTRGRAIDKLLPEDQRGYFYDGHRELGHEVRAAMASLVERYGDRVDLGGAMFAGYSQGASMGILFLQEQATEPALFSRVLLVEGGFADWNIALSERMHRAGVEKVALVCGRTKCQDAGARSIAWMKKGGLPAQITYAQGAGHTSEGTVHPLVDQAFFWLVQGDPRFREHDADAVTRNFGPSK